MSFDDDKVETLLQVIEGWEAEGLGWTPGIENTNWPDAWADVVMWAKDIRSW